MLGWEREEAWRRFADEQDLRLALADLRRDVDDYKLYAAHKRIAALELELKYRPDQPRVPAGYREGGQWTVDRSGTPSAARRRERVDDFGGEIATALGVGVADAAERLPNRRYRVSLLMHEALGGHTIARHTGKSLEFLRRRLAGESIGGSSSFTSVAVAEKAVNGTLAYPEAQPVVFAVQTGARSFAVIDGVGFDPPIGYDENGHPLTSLRIVIVHRTDSPDGFVLLTAFPRR